MRDRTKYFDLHHTYHKKFCAKVCSNSYILWKFNTILALVLCAEVASHPLTFEAFYPGGRGFKVFYKTVNLNMLKDPINHYKSKNLQKFRPSSKTLPGLGDMLPIIWCKENILNWFSVSFKRSVLNSFHNFANFW